MTDFDIFQKNHEFYITYTQHTSQSIHQLQNRINNFHLLNNRQQQHELDLYHLILKHNRHCDSCPNQVLLLHNFIVQLVTANGITCYSLLKCMLGLVKNNCLDQATLQQFLSLSCELWQHAQIYMCRKSMELCRRVIPLVKDTDMIVPYIIKHITKCRKNMTRDDIQRMQAPEYTEFFFHKGEWDRECCKLLVQIVLLMFLYNPHPSLMATIQGNCHYTCILLY
jgi:hypothetical protein